jgi:hypothetical protein
MVEKTRSVAKPHISAGSNVPHNTGKFVPEAQHRGKLCGRAPNETA